MSYSTGELPDAFQSLRLDKLLLKRPFPRARGAIADIADGGHGKNPVFSPDAGEADLDRELGAVAAKRIELGSDAHRTGPWLLEVVLAVIGVGVAKTLRHEHLDHLSEQIVPAVAEKRLGLAVDQDDLAIVGNPDDRVGNGLKQLLKGGIADV